MVHLVRPPIALGFDHDGVDDYIITPNMADYFPNESVTIVVWFYAKNSGVIVDELGQTTINVGWHDSQIEILPTGEVKVRVWALPSVTLGTVGFNEWHQAVLRYDKTALILDGFLDKVEAPTDVSGDRDAPWEFGYNLHYAFGPLDSTNLGDGTYFDGIIALILIYNRPLSASEIADLYDNFKDIKEGLVLKLGTYGLVRGNGTKWLDESPYKNHATVYGPKRVRCCHCNIVRDYGT